MIMIFRACALGSLLWFAPVHETHAENGALGYARPASGIIVDGDLSDWPLNARRHAIETGVFDDGSSWRDAAVFRAAYDPSGTSLYLAIETEDESLGDLPEGGPTDEDTAVIYIDADHNMRGSGPWMFRGEPGRVSNMSEPLSWDPQTDRASDDMVELAVQQSEGRRV